MPTINKRFLLALILVVATSTGALFGLHALQARRIPDALKHQADRSADNGKPDAAVHYLRQYLEFCPTDVDARVQLTELLKKRPSGGDPSEMLFLYDKVLRADADRHAVRREALEVCLLLGRFSDAEAHAGVLLKAFPEDAKLWQMQAAAQAGLHKMDEARLSYESAVKHDPKDVWAYRRLVQFLWRDMQRAEDARAVLDKLVAALPHEAEPYILRAKFDTLTNDAANPIPDLKLALEADPENADALLMLAEQYQKRRDLAAARDCLVDGARLYPQNPQMIRALAWLELNRNNIGAAVAVLEDGLTRVKDGGFDLLVPLGDLLVQLGEVKRTEEIVKRLESRPEKSSKMQVKYLKARLAMRQANWGSAAELLSSLRADASNDRIPLMGLENQANLLLALCQQRQGNADAEQDTLKLVLNKDPNHLAARVALGQSYLNMGKVIDAEKEYDQAVRSPFASGTTHAMLVRLKALRLKAAGAQPQQWDNLERVAIELRRAFGPASPEPALLRAEMATLRGDLSKAITILRSEVTRRPGEPRLWAALADATASLAGVATGLGVLDEAQAATGDGPDLRVARADLYARDPARVRPLEPLADHIDTWPDADQLRLLYGLLEVYDRLGDDANVLRISRRITARRPADTSVWEALAERAYRVGDAKAAAEARAALVKLDATGKSTALCDGWAVAADADPQPAIAAIVKAFGDQPERAEACVLLAKLKARTGDIPAAVALLERAMRLEPIRFGPTKEALTQLVSAKQTEKVTALLARLGQDPRWVGEPFRRVVRAAARNTDTAGAKWLLDTARPAIESRPGGLGWLGDSYLTVRQPAAAIECYRKATLLPRPSPDDWLRLAVRSAEANNQPAAEAAMTAAKKALPISLYLALAASFADGSSAPANWNPGISSPAEKRAYVQARLALKLSRFQRTEAAELLTKYLASDEKLPTADAAWARRNLAMLLVIKGGKADRDRAMKMLAESKTIEGDTPDEKRATAAVFVALSRYIDGSERQEVLEQAAKVLERLVKETKSPRDLFTLAQVYRSAGNRKASTEVMNNLLAADPRNLDFHIFALEELTRGGEAQLKAGEGFAQRLLQEYPTEFRVIATVARYECAAGRPDRALALAEGYTRTADNTAGDLPARQARAAELLDELARLPKIRRTEIGSRMSRAAIEWYESLAATRPEAVIAAASLAAADGRPADGFALIDRFARSQSNRLKAAAGLGILRAGEATDRQFITVRGWLDSALAEEPDSIPLRLNQGEFFALMLDYAEAEKAYEAVLTADPKNVVALNNLAWILAPRTDAVERAMELVDRAVAEVGLTGELLDTRARVRIAGKQFEPAERDIEQSLTQDRTPLRLFHLALAKQTQSPPQTSEAVKAFRQARERGLEPNTIHPADLPLYRAIESESGLVRKKVD